MIKQAVFAGTMLCFASFPAFAVQSGANDLHSLQMTAVEASTYGAAATEFDGKRRKPSIFRDVFDTSGGP